MALRQNLNAAKSSADQKEKHHILFTPEVSGHLCTFLSHSQISRLQSSSKALSNHLDGEIKSSKALKLKYCDSLKEAKETLKKLFTSAHLKNQEATIINAYLNKEIQPLLEAFKKNKKQANRRECLMKSPATLIRGISAGLAASFFTSISSTACYWSNFFSNNLNIVSRMVFKDCLQGYPSFLFREDPATGVYITVGLVVTSVLAFVAYDNSSYHSKESKVAEQALNELTKELTAVIKQFDQIASACKALGKDLKTELQELLLGNLQQEAKEEKRARPG